MKALAEQIGDLDGGRRGWDVVQLGHAVEYRQRVC